MAKPQASSSSPSLAQEAWGAMPEDVLGMGARPRGAAGEEHPSTASVWEIVVGCMGGGCCTHGLV